MPRADLRDNLIDDLVDVVDEVRDDVNIDLGIRPWRVFLVRRRWSGVEVGDGDVTVTSRVELRPQPEVFVPGLRLLLAVTGLVEDGPIELHEVSLRLREDELQPRDLDKTEEFYYELTAALGQKQVTRRYVLLKPPEADRTDDVGWVVTLTSVQKVDPNDARGLAAQLATPMGGP